MNAVKTPTPGELAKARKLYEENEPRDLFYRVVTELIELAHRQQTKISLSEALAVLLQTWNRGYYRYRKFDNEHFKAIDDLMTNNLQVLATLRGRSLSSLSEADHPIVLQIYSAFESVLKPVGAAKALHLLAPLFFPLWDSSIAIAYECGLGPAGTNAGDYFRFMTLVKKQVDGLSSQVPATVNLLKAVDEYNYCKYTKRWM